MLKSSASLGGGLPGGSPSTLYVASDTYANIVANYPAANYPNYTAAFATDLQREVYAISGTWSDAHFNASQVTSGTIDQARLPSIATNADTLASSFQYIDHRGMGGVFPEHTMVAYRTSVALGAKFIECDCHKLKDGSLGVMHDTTVDRTTTGSGNVADMVQSEYQQLVVDCSSWFGANYANTVPPVFSDVVREFGNKVVLIPEAKNTGAGALIVAELQKNGVRKDMAIVQSFFEAELTAAIAAGYRTMFLMGSYTGSPTPSALVASGYTWIGVGSGSSTASCDAARAAGIKVAIYTLNRVADCAGWLSHSDAIWSDESAYLRGTAKTTSDPFASTVYHPGHLEGVNAGIFSGRGQFYSGGYWGNDVSSGNTWSSVLMGWANIATPTNFVINFTIKFGAAFDSTRLAGLFVGTSDLALATDAGVAGLNGYHFYARKDGRISINRYDGAGNWLIGNNAGTGAIADGATATYRITVTPSQVTFERTDVAYSTGAVSDSTHRGSYLHACIKGLFAKFKGITIT